MKTVTLIITMAGALLAQSAATPAAKVEPSKAAPAPELTIAQVQAENEYLKAQLAELKLSFNYQLQVCGAPDLMAAKNATAQAAQKLEQTKKPATQ